MKKLILLLILLPTLCFAGLQEKQCAVIAKKNVVAPSGITYRAVGTFYTDTNTASPVVTKPSGVVDGDFILVAVTTDATHVINTVIDGWTQIGTAQDASTDSTTSIFYKIASSEGASWTFTNLFVDTEAWSGVVIAYSGVNPTTPLDVAVVQGSETANTTFSTDAITPTSNNAMIVSIWGVDASEDYEGTPDSDPACTERAEYQNTAGNYGWTYIQEHKQTTAAEEIHDLTINVSDLMSWFIIALRPE
jgi:hypothetical protein